MSGEQQRRGTPTMKDVAQEAGVSKALVSIVFRGAPGAGEATRRRVFEAAERLGYRANRTASLLASARTRQLGIVHDLHNGFHAEVVEAVLEAADEAGYRVVVSPRTRGQSEADAVAAALEFRCEGLLLVGPTMTDDLLPELTAGLPTVLIGRSSDDDRFDTAAVSDAAGMRLIVEHLASLGHRRIMHLDGGSGSLSRRRRKGFLDAMDQYGLSVEGAVLEAGATEEEGRKAAAQVVNTDKAVTAFIAFNDLAALGAIDAIRGEGLECPGDISVVGYDDSPLARTSAISLTSIRQGAHDLGSWSVRALLERLDEGRSESCDFTLEPTLKIRGTSGRARW